MKRIVLNDFEIANDRPFVLIGGPCSLEGEAHAVKMAGALREITSALGIPYVFKGSYDKAQRTSIHGRRGVGLEEGLRIHDLIRKSVGVPVTSDAHTVEQFRIAGEVLDVVQVPADLSRQTDILVAAGETGKVVNVKKGQFLSPHVAEDTFIGKAASTGNDQVMITERGTPFGNGDLVADMRSIAIMKRTGHPIIFDASHTVQKPNAGDGKSGGDRTMIEPLARAAIGVGVAGIFMEIHDDPDNAWSDGPSSLRLEDAEALLKMLQKIDNAVK